MPVSTRDAFDSHITVYADNEHFDPWGGEMTALGSEIQSQRF